MCKDQPHIPKLAEDYHKALVARKGLRDLTTHNELSANAVHLDRRQRMSNTWNRIINNYSSSALILEVDKLVAISGIASQFQEVRSVLSSHSSLTAVNCPG
jgi:hypothetical protein